MHYYKEKITSDYIKREIVKKNIYADTIEYIVHVEDYKNIVS